MSEDGLDFRIWLAKISDGKPLTEAESEAAFDAMMSGYATPSQIGGFLMALRVRGETIDEIVGAARSMRARAITLQAPAEAIDTCGTGGDARGTFNISTAAAFVIAACGVPVAKHGNRNLSSKSGSADVLTALGVNIDAPMSIVERSMREVGIGFMMAPRHHAATRHVAPTRLELGTRTIFNMLGPLANPAGVKRQVMGVFAAHWVKPLAQVLSRLGTTACWVVHGDGLDELTTSGRSEIAALADGVIRHFTLEPEDAGLTRAREADLAGGTPAENAETMRAFLAGRTGPIRDIVLLNAAAALIVSGTVRSLRDGMSRAGDAVDSGKAQQILDHLVRFTSADHD